jgi:hypothetical protein
MYLEAMCCVVLQLMTPDGFCCGSATRFAIRPNRHRLKTSARYTAEQRLNGYPLPVMPKGSRANVPSPETFDLPVSSCHPGCACGK